MSSQSASDFSYIKTSFPVDVSTLMESYRKNMQTFAQVQQMAMDGVQILTRSYSDLMADWVAGNTDSMKMMASNDRLDTKIEDQILLFQDMLNRTSARIREISDIAHQSRRVTGDTVRSRLSDHLGDMKTAMHRAKARRHQA